MRQPDRREQISPALLLVAGIFLRRVGLFRKNHNQKHFKLLRGAHCMRMPGGHHDAFPGMQDVPVLIDLYFSHPVQGNHQGVAR